MVIAGTAHQNIRGVVAVELVVAPLAAEGVGTGDRVAYLGKNCDRYFELLFGCARAGAVLTPISWRLSAAEIDYVIIPEPLNVDRVCIGHRGVYWFAQ